MGPESLDLLSSLSQSPPSFCAHSAHGPSAHPALQTWATHQLLSSLPLTQTQSVHHKILQTYPS